MADRPTFSFLIRHPAHFIALGAGAGLAPAAPGTFGTLAAIPLALVLRAFFGDAEFVAAIAVLFGVGAWASQVAGRNLGESDHGAIVVDEIAAFLLVLFFVGADWVHVAFAFLLFRLFDIWKPPPIRQLDAAIKNGVGVMLDDLLAAVYTLVVFALWQRVFG
jgi:phosphatidylglycerophosphatase A